MQAAWIRQVQAAARVPKRIPLEAGLHVDGGLAVLAELEARGFNFDAIDTDPQGATRSAIAQVFRSSIGGHDLDASGRMRTINKGGSPTMPEWNARNKDLREFRDSDFERYKAELVEAHGRGAYQAEAMRRRMANVDRSQGADERARQGARRPSEDEAATQRAQEAAAEIARLRDQLAQADLDKERAVKRALEKAKLEGKKTDDS